MAANVDKVSFNPVAPQDILSACRRFGVFSPLGGGGEVEENLAFSII